MKTTETLLTQFWVIIYITSEFNFHEKHRNFIGLVLGNNLLKSEFTFHEKNRNFVDSILVIIYVTNEFNFYEKKPGSFTALVFGNNLHN